MGIAVQALDGVHGRSAAGVRMRLDHADGGRWSAVDEAETGPDGGVRGWQARTFDRGLYRIVFDSDRYFAGLGLGSAYPGVAITFRVGDEAGLCHIRVLLTPHTYSAYIGSAG